MYSSTNASSSSACRRLRFGSDVRIVSGMGQCILSALMTSHALKFNNNDEDMLLTSWSKEASVYFIYRDGGRRSGDVNGSLSSRNTRHQQLGFCHGIDELSCHCQPSATSKIHTCVNITMAINHRNRLYIYMFALSLTLVFLAVERHLR